MHTKEGNKMSDQSQQSLVVSGITTTSGNYLELPIVDLSYYPHEMLSMRVKTTLYGANPTESASWKRAEEEDRRVPIHRPLANTRAEGRFLLFLPANERPWGMMEVSELKPLKRRELDLTLAVIPSLALMPFRLYINSGQVWEEGGKILGKFYVVDREGSNWSVHCH